MTNEYWTENIPVNNAHGTLNVFHYEAGSITAAASHMIMSGTDIRDGINAATAELTSVRADATRTQMMVVMSDGGSTSSLNVVRNAAANAMGSGIEAIHSVGISSSHNATVMRGMVTCYVSKYLT